MRCERLYYVEYVLQAPNAEVFLLLYFVTGILFLAAWVWLARRWEKKAAGLASMAINTGAFTGVYFLGPGDVSGDAALVVLSGVGMGAVLALLSSIQSPRVQWTLRALYALVPCVCSVVGFGIALLYPIDRGRRAIEDRRAGLAGPLAAGESAS